MYQRLPDLFPVKRTIGIQDMMEKLLAQNKAPIFPVIQVKGIPEIKG